MSDRVRRPPPTDHVSMPPKRRLTHPAPIPPQMAFAMRGEIGRMVQAAIEDSRASRSPARRFYPTPADRERNARAKAASPATREHAIPKDDRGYVSPLGGQAR
jgi:hypothetical protein